MIEENEDIPKFYLDFRDKLHALMSKVALYVTLRCSQDEVNDAVQAVYREFNYVVERAYYMQETIKTMHEMEEQYKADKG